MPVLTTTYNESFSPATYRPVLDPTGLLAANRVSGERQTLTAANGSDYQFIVPLFAPFFGDAAHFSIIYLPFAAGSSSRTLVLGVDYMFSFQFIGASRACAKPIYGGISFLNTQLAGTMTLDYQTLGGTWTIGQTEINRILADAITNPRVTAWEQIIDRPLLFPVIDHQWNLDDLVGAKEIVDEIALVATAIANRPTAPSVVGLPAHIADHSNPHVVTKQQVGLGDVQNFGIATLQQASAGATDKYVTPFIVQQMVNGAVPVISRATDDLAGTVALNIGNYGTDPINSTDALTAAGFNAMVNSPSALNAIQLAIAEVLKRIVPISGATGNQVVKNTDGIYVGTNASAEIANIYVDAINGDDNALGSVSAPMRTISAAVNKGPSGINRVLRLKNGQTHNVSTASPTYFRGGKWIILPYGSLLDAITTGNGFKPNTVEAANLNTFIVASDWYALDNGPGGIIQIGTALAPSDNAEVYTYGISFQCGKQLNNIIARSSSIGSFHNYDRKGTWQINFANINMPDASSVFFCPIQFSEFSLNLRNVYLYGLGKLGIPDSKSFTLNFYKTPSFGSSVSVLRSYLGNGEKVSEVYANFNSNIAPVPESTYALPVPVGGIIFYSGAANTIPTGWALCDGTNGTPDLRGRFIVGSLGSFPTGSTGGSREAIVVAHNHTATSTFTGTAMPGHDHSVTDAGHSHTIVDAGHSHGFSAASAPTPRGFAAGPEGDGRSISSLSTEVSGTGISISLAGTGVDINFTSAGVPSGSVTTAVASTGATTLDANLPPYYALAYIICVGIA